MNKVLLVEDENDLRKIIANYLKQANFTVVEAADGEQALSLFADGEYDLVILKNGYTEWSQHVTLDKDTLNVTAELQKDVQYGTLTVTADVDGAWVYINGEEYGVAPMQVNLPYGSYNVMLEKSGYQSYKQSIQISSQTAAIHATME